MSPIRLLPEALINRIAAGEVVERPASVLKELIENSLDAGATRIDIETERGGARLIRVADNGGGMSADDLLLAIERHATSKLSEETDLMRIGNTGLSGRGPAQYRFGFQNDHNHVGRIRWLRPPGRSLRRAADRGGGRGPGPGTTIEVRDLFFNVPARRKFLKSVQTEAAHLLETAQRFALGRSELRLTYRHNGQESLSTSPREDDRTRVAGVLGRDAARAMIPFEGGSGAVVCFRIPGPGRS